MKKFNLSFATILAIGSCSLLNADNLQEALQNGKITGDANITYEKRKQDKEISSYYSNTAYSIASVGVNYNSGSFYDFSFNLGVRAYKTIYEDDKNFITSTGKGDASERFYETGKNRTVDIENAYLAYNNNGISVKAGRQAISTDWINKTHDAIKIDYTFNNTSIEAIWSSRQGRIYARDYRPMTKINPDEGGVYKLGIAHKYNEMINTAAYAVIAPDLKDIYGAKVNFNHDINNLKLSAMGHYAQTKEDVKNVKDSDLIELKTSANISGYTATLAYIQISDDAPFNHIAGEIINPFEEGDQLYLKDAKTTYFMLSKAFGDLSLTGLYGYTKYDKFNKSEFNLWAGYKFTNNLSLNLGYALTNEDKDDSSTTDLNQFNSTLTYKF